MSYITLRERLANIVEDWSGRKKEVRHTAVGWQPDAGYVEDLGCTPSGEREFYQVVKPGRKPPLPTPGARLMTPEEYQEYIDRERW